MNHTEDVPPAGTISLPHNLDAERALLGAVIVNNGAYEHLGHVRAGHFYRQAHQRIFDAIVALVDRRSGVDFTTLGAELRRMKATDDVGGMAYISSLVDGVPRSTNARYYADIVIEHAHRRALVLAGAAIIDLATAGEHDADTVRQRADKLISDVGTQAGGGQGALSLAETAAERFADLEDRMARRGELFGITTGYPHLNTETSGWQRGDLVILAARPSIGKSAFAVNAIVHAARAKARCAVFSFEMRRRQLEHRILAQLSGVALTRIQGGHVGTSDYAHLSHAIEEMAQLPVYIDDRPGQTVPEVRATCRQLKADGGLDLVCVDYVQLVASTLERKSANRNEELTDISRRLKALAAELSVPVVLVSQLRRVEGRPKLDDLRESGALEQDADIVAFLHRKDHRMGGLTELILAKQRTGPTGSIYLKLDRDTTTFHQAEAPTQPEEAPAPPRREKTYAQRYSHHGTS